MLIVKKCSVTGRSGQGFYKFWINLYRNLIPLWRSWRNINLLIRRRIAPGQHFAQKTAILFKATRLKEDQVCSLTDSVDMLNRLIGARALCSLAAITAGKAKDTCQISKAIIHEILFAESRSCTMSSLRLDLPLDPGKMECSSSC